jgi:hypothetical protein
MNDENAPDLSLSADAAAARLDVALHELAGVGPAPDLATRVLAAIAAERPGRRALAPTQWLLAATALFGVGIVGAVAWLQRGAASSQATAPVPQDPQPTPTPAPAPKQDPKQEAKKEAKPAPVPAPRGLTWIADYSDNRVIAVDADGKVVEHYDEVYGAWDVEPIGDDRLLVTEFAVSRVREIDRKTKKTVWEFENLKNPYDADRLPNGNTLIADTFGGRVIEIDRDGKIVWSFAKDIRPFDADRLANGNTLIADVLKDRVIEVNAAGEIVWEVKGQPNAHDADRLPNGNTLVTLRNKGMVVELDPQGDVVWKLEGLSSPSDADRLPNGNTLVAENTRVREFDSKQKVVWEKNATWAVEVCRSER